MDILKYRTLIGSTRLLELVTSSEDCIREAQPIVDFLEPQIDARLTSLTPESRPDAANSVRRAAKQLIQWGFMTQALLNRPPHRCYYSSVDMQSMLGEWAVASVTGLSLVADLDRGPHRGFLDRVFSVLYEAEVMPLERELRSGWFRRMRNRPKWLAFFAEGVTLCIAMDRATAAIAIR
jgi:hypothetical protein